MDSIHNILSNRIIRNLTAVFVGDILSKLIAIFLTIILARYLEPEKYGIYAFITSYVFIFLVIADFGLNDLLVRDIAKTKSMTVRYFTAATIIKGTLSLASMIVMISTVIMMGHSKEKVIYASIISFSIFFICLNNSIASIFQAYEQMEYSSFLTIIGSLLLLLLTFILIYFRANISWIIGARVISVSTVTVIGLYLIMKLIRRIYEPITLPDIRHVVVNSFPFLANGLIHALYISLDVVMLSSMKGDIYVGWFTTAANDLFFSLMIIPGAVSTVVYPLFSRQYVNSTESLIRSCNFSIKMLTNIGIAISMGSFYLAPQIIHFVFGSKYANSVDVLQIISPAIGFAFISNPIGYALSAIGEVKALMFINLFMLILNAVINLLLIPFYAHIGAAIASASCILLSLILSQFVLNKKLGGIVISTNLLKPFAAACCMLLALYLLNNFHVHVIVNIIAGAIVYIFALFLFKAIDNNDLEILKNMLIRR